MSLIDEIWKQFLKDILTNTFSEFLSESEIEQRVNWIVSNLHDFKPFCLYKSILYSMNNTAISKMAVGFKLHFILDDYQKLFIEPYTEEIDKNQSLSTDDKAMLDNIILNFCKVINHHIEKVINGENRVEDIDITVKEVSKFLEMPSYDHLKSSFIKDGNIVHYMTFSQLLYCTAFNQNPFTGLPCSNQVKSYISSMYHNRVQMMLCLKDTWSTGIPLQYVRSVNIFG